MGVIFVHGVVVAAGHTDIGIEGVGLWDIGDYSRGLGLIPVLRAVVHKKLITGLRTEKKKIINK